MSLFPCQVHGSRISGPLDAIYFGLMRGESRYQRKLRVCPSDLDEILATHAAEWTSVDTDDGSLEIQVCGACGAAPEGDVRFDALFATVYRRGADRSDYFGRYCPKCSNGVVDTFGLTSAQAD